MKSKIFTSLIFLCSWYSIIGQGIVSTNGLLKVNGNQVENKNGTPFSVAGMSMFWSSFQNDGGSFYTTEVVNHLAEEWDIQVIRAAMGVEEADGATQQNSNADFPNGISPNPNGEGYYNDPAGELAKVKTIIDAAIANDIYVIVDYHTHFAHFFKDEAITFFTAIANEYGNDEHIIYEIFNEPIGPADNRANGADNQAWANFTPTWNDIIKPYAIDVINAIRAIDPDNLIIVGTPGFSQGVGAAAANPITTSDLNLPNEADLNVAYTLHFYAAQTEHDALISSATQAMNSGIALFVTEWGTVEASGDGAVDEAQTKTWVEFMKANDISHANWSITDKGEGASSIQPGKGIQGLLDGELSESGSFVKCIIENWQADSFDNCSPTEVVVVDSEDIPNGQGSKIEVESGIIISPNDELGLDWLGDSGNVDTGEYDGEGIVTGLGSVSGQWIAATFNGSAQGDYTIQLVVSSNSDGNGIILQRQFGEENLTGLIEIPNTGGLNSYEIVTISGIPFSSTVYTNGTAQDLSISIQGGGSGSFNMESFYMILDSEFDENELSTPTFSPELAKLINVYPNPVVDFITVDTDEDVEYRIFDLSGSELVTQTEYTDAVDVTSLSTGIYFIQLYVKNQTQVYKFIKK